MRKKVTTAVVFRAGKESNNMCRGLGVLIFHALAAMSIAQVFVYEGDNLPESSGWEVVQRVCDPVSWVADGWYHQILEHKESCPISKIVDEAFRRSLSDFDGETRFFLEVRVEGEGPRSEIPWGGPAAFALYGNAGVNYSIYIARDQAKFNRDNRLPIIFADLEPSVAHTHRIELYDDDLYIWFIDGIAVDSDVPEGQFPSFSPFVVWDGRGRYADTAVRWDYIRYGRIAEDGSGDFDSDGDIDLRDLFYFVECLDNSGPLAPSGPGCRWADLDGDTDTDLRDFSKLQNSYTGSK